MNMFEQMPFSEKYPVFRKFCLTRPEGAEASSERS